jgi:hypothetical protein
MENLLLIKTYQVFSLIFDLLLHTGVWRKIGGAAQTCRICLAETL